MFLSITLERPTAVLADRARTTLKEWEDEHARYYAKHPRKLCVGYLPNGNTVAGARAGYHAYPNGGAWLTSGDNLHKVTLFGDGLTMLYKGRRHGMRRDFAELLEQAWTNSTAHRIYLTQEPTWAPWETADDYCRPTLQLLEAERSMHRCECYAQEGSRGTAESFPEDDLKQSYLYTETSHIWLRPDVEVERNDIYGAEIAFDPAKGCPFVAPEPHLIECLEERDAERQGDVDA